MAISVVKGKGRYVAVFKTAVCVILQLQNSVFSKCSILSNISVQVLPPPRLSMECMLQPHYNKLDGVAPLIADPPPMKLHQ